jgi:hypothetical protein
LNGLRPQLPGADHDPLADRGYVVDNEEYQGGARLEQRRSRITRKLRNVECSVAGVHVDRVGRLKLKEALTADQCYRYMDVEGGSTHVTESNDVRVKGAPDENNLCRCYCGLVR